MSYQTSSKRSPPFWLLIGVRKLVWKLSGGTSVHRLLGLRGCVNLNYSTEVHFALFYWFKSRTWKTRMCHCYGEVWETKNMAANLAMEKEHTFESKKRWFSTLIRISQCDAFEVLEARGKLNIVLSSFLRIWENAGLYYESKLQLNTCCRRCLFCTSALRYGKLIELKTPWTHQEHAWHASCLSQGIIH